MVKYRTSWWQFWRRKPCVEIPCPPFESVRLDYSPPIPGLTHLDGSPVRVVPQDHRDTWPPSWTDETDEPAPADITEWTLLDPPPPVPEAEDEDDRRQAP